MIDAKELRIGNWVANTYNTELIIVEEILNNSINYMDEHSKINNFPFEELEPIPLSSEILEKCEGFYQLPHFTVQDNWIIDVGRNRFVSVACVGTPNEMVFLTEEEAPEVKNIIVLRNYDYDGKTYLHQLQNIINSFTDINFAYTP